MNKLTNQTPHLLQETTKRIKLTPIKKGAGFTLIDLIVSTAILMILLTFVIANLRGAGGNDFQLMLNQSAGDITQTQIQGTAGQVVEVCYIDEVPSGLCQLNPGCGNCPQVYPAGGYGIQLSRCDDAPCSYKMFADVNNNHQADSNEIRQEPTLGKSYIDEIYFTDQEAPPTIFSGWPLVAASKVVIIFNQNDVAVYFDNAKQETITYLGWRLKNKKFPGDGYVYLSVKTGFVASGVIK